ncbi:MAG: hypothetical protein QOJ72_1157 [Nocardioidaceae bacterium]|nr:hypothetical protein [Nocardioidaceae bacterium]
MNRTYARRLGAAVITPVLAFGALAGTTQSAQAAGPNSYAYSSAGWLSDQLTDGLIHNPNFGGFDDYGLSIDTFLALHTLGTRTSAATSIINALKADPTLYTTGEAFGDPGSQYAGASGKLAAAVQLQGDDTTDFGGHDLITELEDLVTLSGAGAGRAVDTSTFGDSSNAIGQSWDVRALAVAHSGLAQSATNYLLKQQCNDGSVRVQESDIQCTTDHGTVDGTAFAIQALEVAKANGVTDVQDDIDSAVSWLIADQAPDGSYSDDGTANTNSTGLAAATLKTEGKLGPAGNAAAWLVSHEVTDAVADDTALSNELGATAFDQDALDAGKTDGITDATRDQWRRATTQAAIGINALLPAKALTATTPDVYKSGGKKVTISVSGLEPGEKFKIALEGSPSASGTASATGTGSAAIATATSTANRTATVTGSRSSRVGTTTVKVLGAKTLSPKVKYATKVHNHTQVVSVSGLAPGEEVSVGYAGKVIKTSTASSTGTFSYSFNVGSKTGTQTVSIRGEFSNRHGVKTFKVS